MRVRGGEPRTSWHMKRKIAFAINKGETKPEAFFALRYLSSARKIVPHVFIHRGGKMLPEKFFLF